MEGPLGKLNVARRIDQGNVSMKAPTPPLFCTHPPACDEAAARKKYGDYYTGPPGIIL